MAAHVHFQPFLLRYSQPVRIWRATLWYVTQYASQMHGYADVGWIAYSHAFTIQNGIVYSLKNKSQTTRKIFSSFLISRVNRVHLVWPIPFLRLVQMWRPLLFISFHRSFRWFPRNKSEDSSFMKQQCRSWVIARHSVLVRNWIRRPENWPRNRPIGRRRKEESVLLRAVKNGIQSTKE